LVIVLGIVIFCVNQKFFLQKCEFPL